MENFVNPSREQFSAFRALERSGSVHMLNLVKLKDTAVYPDGTMVSGREAYAAYGRESGPIFQRVGGRIVWSSSYETMVIGPQSEGWDLMFVAEYPTSDAFVEMVKDPKYQEAVVHRTAAVEDSRLIRTEPKTGSGIFG